MKIGELDVSKIMLGSDEVEKVYLGTEQVYGGSEPQPDPYSEQYLTFVAKESGTFKFTGNDIDYSIDSGNTWTTLASDTDSPTVASGDTIMWKATLAQLYYQSIGTFSSTGQFDVEGNVMSLLYGDNFEGETSLSGNPYAFANLFYASNVVNAENLVLPATTLADSCYASMFYGCTSLTAAPALPATTLTNWCYSQMFYGCTSLTTAPELPATTLARYSYINMFRNCSSLNYVKCLATDISATNCTYYWVDGVSATGTFVKNSSMTGWTTGESGIPSGWTVQDA